MVSRMVTVELNQCENLCIVQCTHCVWNMSPSHVMESESESEMESGSKSEMESESKSEMESESGNVNKS